MQLHTDRGNLPNLPIIVMKQELLLPMLCAVRLFLRLRLKQLRHPVWRAAWHRTKLEAP